MIGIVLNSSSFFDLKSSLYITVLRQTSYFEVSLSKSHINPTMHNLSINLLSIITKPSLPFVEYLSLFELYLSIIFEYAF